ncbi:hypothetical protein A2818_02710 [Candidatus Nomurabacteria bacterium RIFCSPHIGHO2_01_FULL_40_12]|uniref:Uncharacterized protein n=1 Tax=Candidatus Nomurabacteria bacterium RIFCSPHIGHO2_01_FULL_40_12 TaxID=1801737 RepID=A0A1F6UZC5_9BACT|nr:MAG: hypothetical protein A2818_02710 [Candidatus Nomurabacteria bacterium RIFCSPHIGHO2_01_FULL_40_12]
MIKIFKKEKNFKKEGPWLNINFYWQLAVCIVFLTILLSLFFGYYLFMQINKEAVLEESSVSGQLETVKKERIDKVLLYFSLRAEKSNQILNSPSPIIDPSW